MHGECGGYLRFGHYLQSTQHSLLPCFFILFVKPSTKQECRRAFGNLWCNRNLLSFSSELSWALIEWMLKVESNHKVVGNWGGENCQRMSDHPFTSDTRKYLNLNFGGNRKMGSDNLFFPHSCYLLLIKVGVWGGIVGTQKCHEVPKSTVKVP